MTVLSRIIVNRKIVWALENGELEKHQTSEDTPYTVRRKVLFTFYYFIKGIWLLKNFDETGRIKVICDGC